MALRVLYVAALRSKIAFAYIAPLFLALSTGFSWPPNRAFLGCIEYMSTVKSSASFQSEAEHIPIGRDLHWLRDALLDEKTETTK